MKNYYFIYIILYSSILMAQDISGSIKDRITNASLSGVNITVQNSEYGVSSDELGNYVLDITDFNNDQVVKFQHIGYEEIFIRVDSLAKSSHLRMMPRAIQFETIETAGNKRKPTIEKDLPQTVSIIQSDSFELRGYTDVGDLLGTDQSIQV